MRCQINDEPYLKVYKQAYDRFLKTNVNNHFGKLISSHSIIFNKSSVLSVTEKKIESGSLFALASLCSRLVHNEATLSQTSIDLQPKLESPARLAFIQFIYINLLITGNGKEIE